MLNKWQSWSDFKPFCSPLHIWVQLHGILSALNEEGDVRSWGNCIAELKSKKTDKIQNNEIMYKYSQREIRKYQTTVNDQLRFIYFIIIVKYPNMLTSRTTGIWKMGNSRIQSVKDSFEKECLKPWTSFNVHRCIETTLRIISPSKSSDKV